MLGEVVGEPAERGDETLAPHQVLTLPGRRGDDLHSPRVGGIALAADKLPGGKGIDSSARGRNRDTQRLGERPHPAGAFADDHTERDRLGRGQLRRRELFSVSSSAAEARPRGG